MITFIDIDQQDANLQKNPRKQQIQACYLKLIVINAIEMRKW